MALRDRLISGTGEEAAPPADVSSQGPAIDELEDPVATAPKNPTRLRPRPPILDLLCSATSSLGDEDRFIALIEAANGHDDHYDPTDPKTLEAMKTLLEEEALELGESLRAPAPGRLRAELWTHLVWGYRVGRYLLTTHSRRPSLAENARSYVASDLTSYVGEARQQPEIEDILSAPDLGAALHYHAFSSTLLASLDVDRTQARSWVRLVEDLGFLTALGAEDLASDPMFELDEPGAELAGRA
jgi:hypothetical protein